MATFRGVSSIFFLAAAGFGAAVFGVSRLQLQVKKGNLGHFFNLVKLCILQRTAGNKNVVVAHGKKLQIKPASLAQLPLNSVADNCLADFFRYGKTYLSGS